MNDIEMDLALRIAVAQDEARHIVLDLPRQQALVVAEEFYFKGTWRSDERTIPYAFIYTKDGIDAACDKLLMVMKTPDLQPPTLDPQSEKVKLDLLTALYRNFEGYSQNFGFHGAAMMYAAITGEEDQPTKFSFYQDLGRLHPSKTADWVTRLTEQFGQDVFDTAKSTKPAFFNLLDESVASGNEWAQPTPILGQEQYGQIITDLVNQGLKALSELGPETLEKLHRIKHEQTYGEYLKRSYMLRGLTYQGLSKG